MNYFLSRTGVYNYLVEHNKFTDLGAVVKLGVGKKNGSIN